MFFNVAYSPDGKWIAATSLDGTVWLWDATTGREADIRRNPVSRVLGVAFSPDSTRYAAASEDGQVRMWDVATGELLITISLDGDSPLCVTFSPDGKWLVSGTTTGQIKIWDATTTVGSPVWSEREGGRQILSIQAHPRMIKSVVFTRDGSRLASASDDKTVKVWKVTPAANAVGAASQADSQVTTNPSEPDDPRLHGNWRVTSAVRDGVKLDSEEFADWKMQMAGRRFTFQWDGATHRGTYYVGREGLFTFYPTEGPDRGKSILAIYEITGDTLKICMSPPHVHAFPSELTSLPGSGRTLVELKRERTPDDTDEVKTQGK